MIVGNRMRRLALGSRVPVRGALSQGRAARPKLLKQPQRGFLSHRSFEPSPGAGGGPPAPVPASYAQPTPNSPQALEYVRKRMAQLQQVLPLLPPGFAESLHGLTGPDGERETQQFSPRDDWTQASTAFAQFSDQQGHANPTEFLRTLLRRSRRQYLR